jgi:hypothetical protein
MSKGPDHFITFRSNLFSMEQRDHYINPCCFCEDLAEWLGESLSTALPSMALDVYQEDFGWVVELVPQEATHEIRVIAQTFLTYEDETSDEFGVHIWSRTLGLWRRLVSPTPATMVESRHLVVRAIDAALHAEIGIRQIEWWREGFAVGPSTPHPIVV